MRRLKIKIIQWFRRLLNNDKKKAGERFYCPKRAENLMSYKTFPDKDGWRIEKNGDFCCTYCGSLHPEHFLKFCNELVEDPDINKRIEYLSHKGKFYINRPDVQNAMDGAIKAYQLHIDEWLDTFSPEEQEVLIEQLNKAISTSNKKYETHRKSVLNR